MRVFRSFIALSYYNDYRGVIILLDQQVDRTIRTNVYLSSSTILRIWLLDVGLGVNRVQGCRLLLRRFRGKLGGWEITKCGGVVLWWQSVDWTDLPFHRLFKNEVAGQGLDHEGFSRWRRPSNDFTSAGWWRNVGLDLEAVEIRAYAHLATYFGHRLFILPALLLLLAAHLARSPFVWRS